MWGAGRRLCGSFSNAVGRGEGGREGRQGEGQLSRPEWSRQQRQGREALGMQDPLEPGLPRMPAGLWAEAEQDQAWAGPAFWTLPSRAVSPRAPSPVLPCLTS